MSKTSSSPTYSIASIVSSRSRAIERPGRDSASRSFARLSSANQCVRNLHVQLAVEQSVAGHKLPERFSIQPQTTNVERRALRLRLSLVRVDIRKDFLDERSDESAFLDINGHRFDSQATV